MAFILIHVFLKLDSPGPNEFDLVAQNIKLQNHLMRGRSKPTEAGAPCKTNDFWKIKHFIIVHINHLYVSTYIATSVEVITYITFLLPSSICPLTEVVN